MNIELENINGNILEMGNKKLLLHTIIFITFMSCNQGINSLNGEDNVTLRGDDLKILTESLDNDMKHDSIYHFNCGGTNYNIKASKINRAYFPVELRRCLLTSGFNGNQASNSQIAKLVRMLKIDDFLTFGTSPKFRGPEVFEAILSISNDFSRGIAHDEGNGELSTKTKSSGMSNVYIDMIRSIDGEDYTAFRSKIFANYEFKVQEYDPISLEHNFEYAIEESKRYYMAFLNAWKEGRIILKDYGEE